MKAKYIPLIHRLVGLMVMATISFSLFGQNQKMDSLTRSIQTLSKEDTLYVCRLNELAFLYRYVNPDSLLALGNRALSTAKAIHYKKGEAVANDRIGAGMTLLGKSMDAIPYYEESVRLHHEIGDRSGEASAKGNLGVAYSNLSMYNLALKYYKEISVIFLEIKDTLRSEITYQKIGITYGYLGKHEKKLEYLQKALAFARSINDMEGISMIHRNIVETYLIYNYLEDAEKMLNENIELMQSIGNESELVDNYSSLGRVLMAKNQFDEAEKYFVASYKFHKDNNFGERVGNELRHLGLVNRKKKDYSKSNRYYWEAIKVYVELEAPRHLSETYRQLGTSYKEQKRYDSSRVYLNRAVTMANETGNSVIAGDVYHLLYQLDSTLGNYKPALLNFIKSRNIKDSLETVESNSRMQELIIQYETERKERTISEQNDEIRLLAAINQTRTKLVWAIGVGALLLFGGAYLYRSRKFALRARDMQERFTHQLLSSHEEERRRVARDLHDSVGQSLVLIKNKIALQQDESTISMVARALEEVRTISKALHPATLDRVGLTASIKNLIRDADEATDIFFTEEVDNIDEIFSKEYELQIYRIIQESLNNMIKYSQTESAMIMVKHDSGYISIIVKDYGTGFDLTETPEAINSLGMKTLKERAHILGGQLTIESIKGKGTTITLQVTNPSSGKSI